MAHYQAPYHQSYSMIDDNHHNHHRRRGSLAYSDRVEDQSVCSRERFMTGSSRNFDQAPSIHVVKSRDIYMDNSRTIHDDCSERSFQLGMDPIERDWGDSRSRDVCRSGNNSMNMTRSRHSCESSITSAESSLPSRSRDSLMNAFKPSRRADQYPYENEACFPDYSRRPQSKQLQDSCGDTRSTAPSSCCNSGSSTHFRQRRASMTNRYNVDQVESARSSRPDHVQAYHRGNSRRSLLSEQSGHFSSNVSSCGGSVGSRSAPARRTPIPREPSLYRPESSHSHRRTFAYGKRNSMPENTNNQTPRHHHCPPQHIDIVLSQEHGPHNRRASCSDVPQQTMVDIAPGVQAPLRGTQETYKAVAKDFYGNISCFGCNLELCCIADVSYVVCPECKVISPLEGTKFEGKDIQRHGLGLGFNYESLFQMQVEIMEERKARK